jgi:DNA-binding response OmpR family regulator
MRILIAEDQQTLLNILKERLTKEGYHVDAVKNGEQAIDYLQIMDYDVVVLDIMMPIKNGIEVLSYIRQTENQTPVIMLTAKDSIEDRVKGLDTGADDYLVKPFSYDELLARIRSLLRRQNKTIQDVLICQDLIMNRTTNEVKRKGNNIKLTKKEFTILEYLLIHQGEVISREKLEMISSNYDYEGYSNVVDVYIRFLRKKIDDPFETKLIQTVRGFGYQLKEHK